MTETTTKKKVEKKAETAKKPTEKKTQEKKTADKKEDVDAQKLHNEIVLLIVAGVSIILMLGNMRMGGRLGTMLGNFNFGMFGMMAHFLPIALFIGVLFAMSNKDSYIRSKIAARKLLAAAVIYISLCGFLQLATVKYTSKAKLINYFKFSRESRWGGGLIGGIITKTLYPTIGIIAAYCILIIIILICIIIITQRSISLMVKNGSKKVYKTAREVPNRTRDRFTEIHSDSRRQGNRRVDKKARGVILDAKITDEPSADEVREITGNYTKRPVMTNLEITADNPLEVSIIDTDKDKDKKAAEDTILDVKGKQMEFDLEGLEPVIAKEAEEEPVQEEVAKTDKVEEKIGTEDIVVEKIIEEDNYIFPDIELLTKGKAQNTDNLKNEINDIAGRLVDTLKSFGVGVSVTNVSCGPTVTRYELTPEHGVKVSKIVSLTDDIKLSLAATDIRIEAPIPGKSAIGIEVPNRENSTVKLRDLLESREFEKSDSKIAFAAGKDLSGKVVLADIKKMPHLLIAGATGSGKSVCINTIIMSILYKAKPSEVKLIMIDPKVVELSVYNGIPHLLIPVVTEPKKAAGALNWAVAEMTDRYKKFADKNVRNLEGYNELMRQEDEDKRDIMPQIVIIIDELADLMMVAPGEVEDAICRLAQLARAAGIHLVIATQRPSVNVITGLIKANVPSRIAFSVSSGVDSRTIIDMNGAEKLLGKGDMLFYPAGYQKPARVQGAFVSDDEVNKVVAFFNETHTETQYDTEVEAKIESARAVDKKEQAEDRDVLFVEAGKFIIEKDKASIGMLQRVYKIGFNRAARIMDQLSQAGVVGEEEGTKPRKILMSLEQFEEYIEDYV